MKEDSTTSISKIEPIHIGKIIEQELCAQERSVSWLSRKLNCDRRNVYDIFTRRYIDTGLLFRISLALKKDFFAYYSKLIQLSDSEGITPPEEWPCVLTCGPCWG